MANIRRTVNVSTNKTYYYVNGKRVTQDKFDFANNFYKNHSCFNTKISGNFITHTHTAN